MLQDNDFLNHWSYFEPNWNSCFINFDDAYPKELTRIFFIARTLFSKTSTHQVKRDLTPLFEGARSSVKTSSSSSQNEKSSSQKPAQQIVMGNNFSIEKITSFDQICSLLPREFMAYSDLVFYKKLLNRELFRKRFESPYEKTISVDDLIKGERNLNKTQKLYILFDNSTSMEGEQMQKLLVAKAVVLEYLRSVASEGPQIYFRFFTNEPGPLIKATNLNEMKSLIKNIVTLTTKGTKVTDIGKAILQTIEDIHSDLFLTNAEILMITDGLGPFPDNLRELLNDIKLNIILIPSLNLEKIITVCPDRKAWDLLATGEASSFNFLSRSLRESLKMHSLVDNRKRALACKSHNELLLEIDQVYRMQELADIFIRMSLNETNALIFNPDEIDWIQKFRLNLEMRLKEEIGGDEKFIIYKRVEFILEYLRNILQTEFRENVVSLIKQEIAEYTNLKKILLADKRIKHLLEPAIKVESYRLKFKKDTGQKIVVTIADIIKKLLYPLWRLGEVVFKRG
ncbi:MAG: VWA domain-containing protein [bacterium]